MDETCNRANAMDIFHYFLTDLSIVKISCRLINTALFAAKWKEALQLYKEQVNEPVVK